MTQTCPEFVLVNPQLGENIGATARAMLNFGLTRLRLVNPRDGWPNPDAVAMASGAGRILDAAVICADVETALAGFHYVLATTARGRELTKPVLTPAEASLEVHRRMADGQRVAIMFGPERAGLDNSDLAAANAIIAVPANHEFKSLNIAQCALLIAYELRGIMASGVHPGERKEAVAPVPATQHEKAVLYRLFEDDLVAAGYFWPPEKAPSMQMSLRNMFLRLDFSAAEVKTLHGVRKALGRYQPSSGSSAGIAEKDLSCE